MYIPLDLIASLGFRFFASSTTARSSMNPGGVRKVEAALRPWNKILQPFFHLAGVRSGSGDRLVWCILAGSSRVPLDLGEFFCPFFVFSGVDAVVVANSCEATGRFIYHFPKDSGGWFLCNCLGGLSPLSVALSSGDFELPAVLVATNPKFLGDKMAGGHLFLLVRLVDLRHVDDFDVLLGEVVKNFVSSSRWALASSCNLDGFILQPLVRRWIVEGRLLTPVTKTTRRPLGGPKCNFFSKGVFVRVAM